MAALEGKLSEESARVKSLEEGKMSLTMRAAEAEEQKEGKSAIPLSISNHFYIV